jgi:hypothetical protein
MVRGMNREEVTIHDIEHAWYSAQRAKKSYESMIASYREILDTAVSQGQVRQSDISRALGRDRESLRRDRIQAKAERDSWATGG